MMRFIEFPKQTERRANRLDNFVFSSRVRITRNLEGLKFPLFLSEAEKRSINEKIKEIIKKIPFDLVFESLEDLPNEQIMNYVATNVITQDFVRNGRLMAYEINGDWVILINEQDHFRIFAIELGYNIKKMYSRISNVVNILEKDIDFAYDEKWGYLTSSILNVGTGFRMSVIVNLYGLMAAKQVQAFTDSIGSIGYSLVSLNGDGRDNGLFYFSNVYSLGLTEEEMYEEFDQILNRLFNLEMKYREEYFAKREKREQAFEELLEVKQRKQIDWSSMLHYISLVDVLNKKYLTLENFKALRNLIFQASDDYLIYRYHIDPDKVAQVRMGKLKKILGQIKYKKFN